MWRKGLVSLFATLLASSPALGQAGSITGRVTSATEGGAPVGDVQVVVAGTGLGAVTGNDGQYVITNVQPGTYTVRAVRLGYHPDSVTNVVVAPGAPTTVDFQLRQSAVTLATVPVHIGYGEVQQRNLTGAATTVTPQEFNTGRIISPEQLIEGKVAGVQVVPSNEPGGGIQIRVRGGTSVTSLNDPLFVVDGVPLPVGGGITDAAANGAPGRNALNFLNPDDIESITVLKDAAATAIYGSRGANGVVLVTTKSGRNGRGVTFSSSVSQSNVSSNVDLLNASQFRSIVAQYDTSMLSRIGNSNTDWLDAIERPALGQDHTLAIAGGRQDMSYRLSLNYLNQNGVLRGSASDRLATDVSYNDQLLNHSLLVQAHVTGSRVKDYFTPGSVLGWATQMPETAPIVTDSGAWFELHNAIGGLNYQSVGNPIEELSQVYDQGATYRSLGNLQGTYTLPWVAGLSATANLGYDYSQADRTTFYPSTEWSQRATSLGGTISKNTPSMLNEVLETYANYTHDIDPLQSTVNLTAGYSYEQSRADYTSFFAQGLASDLLGPNGIPAARISPPNIFIDNSRLISGYARLNASMKDRYLLTLSIRRDGSSKFGPTHQWGNFPAAAVAWRLSEEPFLKDRYAALSNLKLRLSWGVNGNQAIPNYLAYSSYTYGNNLAQAQFGNQFVTTIRPSAVDPNIHWEQTASTDLGLDYGFLNDRVTGSIDAYHKKTTDLLFNVPVSAGTNLSNFLTTNIGSLRDQGFEFGLNARVLDGGAKGFTWDADFTASTNSNKLLTINPIGGSQLIRVGGIVGGVGSTIQVLEPGQPINSFYVYHQIGDTAGVPIYQDVNGDTVINEKDLRPFHSPAPKWILGHSSQMRYGNFDASFTLRAYIGNYVYNNVASNMGFTGSLAFAGAPFNMSASVLKTGFKSAQYLSDIYVENASFLRMDNITLGYTFRHLAQVQAVRLFGTIQNAFTITGYSGVDPESGINGIDWSVYPRSRTFVLGTNITF